MSLLSLPEETLSQIVRHLPSTDRASLARTHPYLHRTLHPNNHRLWRDIHARRFRRLPPPPRLSSWHRAVSLRDAANDYYIHRSLPFTTLLKGAAPPVIAPASTRLHLASCRLYTTYPTRRPPTPLEATATALSPGPVPAVGLSNGAVHLPETHHSLRGHTGAVLSLAQADGLLASGASDKTIRLRNSATRRTHAVLRGHDAPVVWLALNGAHLHSHAASDARVKLWDVTRAACIATARPGKVVDAALHAGVVYAATDACVHVLDPRLGLATVAVLSLPRGPAWQMGIGRLALAEDGALVACVGGGGVAVWDACGGWVARGLGWPRRWEGREGRRLQALMVGPRSIVAGGGARELLTFARDGGYEGVVAEDGVRKGGVSSLVSTDDGFVIGRCCGRIEMAKVQNGVIDWDVAERVVAEEEDGQERGFWEARRR